mmetsp:Transcript_99773/g.321505  ORF Transcript_99773/g.321505 Transcript_99773/m.321505 type:complete len:187 (+) Transcript_99773:1048-1608(+)
MSLDGAPWSELSAIAVNVVSSMSISAGGLIAWKVHTQTKGAGAMHLIILAMLKATASTTTTTSAILGRNALHFIVIHHHWSLTFWFPREEGTEADVQCSHSALPSTFASYKSTGRSTGAELWRGGKAVRSSSSGVPLPLVRQQRELNRRECAISKGWQLSRAGCAQFVHVLNTCRTCHQVDWDVRF